MIAYIVYAPTGALRSSASKHLQVPRTNLRFGSRSYSQRLQLTASQHSFRKHLKTFYFQSAFSVSP